MKDVIMQNKLKRIHYTANEVEDILYDALEHVKHQFEELEVSVEIQINKIVSGNGVEYGLKYNDKMRGGRFVLRD